MTDCQTFVRGTIRFAGFSNIISAYHDLGLSPDEAIPAGANTLKKVLQSRIGVAPIQKLNSDETAIGLLIAKVAAGFASSDHDDSASFFASILQRVDFGHLLKETTDTELAALTLNKHDEQALLKASHSVLKSLEYLDFFKESEVNTDKKSYLQVLSEAMQGKLALADHDRDLVIMRHEFGIRSDATGKEWKRTSTMVASGNSKASGGFSIMGQTVGFTCAIATRQVLEKKFPQRGVLSPIYPEIYAPILDELNALGITMKEEDQQVPVIFKGPKA